MERAPDELRKLMAEWLIEQGPGGHCDGAEKMADLAWHWFTKGNGPGRDLLAAAKRFAKWAEQNRAPELQGVIDDTFQAIAKAEGR